MTRHHRITAGVGLVAVTAFALLAGPLRAPAQEADATDGAGPSDETGTSVVAAPEIAVDSEISNGQPFGAWRVNCEALGPNRTACALGQRVLRRSDNAFLTDLVALPAPGSPVEGEAPSEGGMTLIARVPTGAHLPSGFVMRGEEGAEQHEFTWQVCAQNLCEAMIALTPEDVAELEAAPDGVLAAYRPGLQAEPLVFRVSFEGAGAGLSALVDAAAEATGE